MASHRSRLAGVYLDVPRQDYGRTVAFWGTALHRDGVADADDPDYVSFGEVGRGLELLVQAVGDPEPRIHLDLETDDVEAEVARLLALGATEVRRLGSWVVMRDPVGTVFCVVRVQLPEAFEAGATTWATTSTGPARDDETRRDG